MRQMQWKDLAHPGLVDALLEFSVEGNGDIEVSRGRIQCVNWMDGLPQFVLPVVQKYDAETGQWTDLKSGMEITLSNEPKERILGPFEDMDGTVSFHTLSGNHGVILPQTKEPPEFPHSVFRMGDILDLFA